METQIVEGKIDLPFAHSSDYFRHLYRHAPDTEQHKVERGAYSYLLNRDFNGIYSPAVIVFRGDETSGHADLEKLFRVNVVAVAGVHRPEPAYAGNGAARMREDGSVLHRLSHGQREHPRRSAPLHRYSGRFQRGVRPSARRKSVHLECCRRGEVRCKP